MYITAYRFFIEKDFYNMWIYLSYSRSLPIPPTLSTHDIDLKAKVIKEEIESYRWMVSDVCVIVTFIDIFSHTIHEHKALHEA